MPLTKKKTLRVARTITQAIEAGVLTVVIISLNF